MKLTLLLAVFIASSAFSDEPTATPGSPFLDPQASGFQCGLKPIPPIGCTYNSARCVCSSNGNCQWVFDC